MVSYRRKDGREIPYELNTTCFSALKDDDEELSIRKYLCSIAVALSIDGKTFKRGKELDLIGKKEISGLC